MRKRRVARQVVLVLLSSSFGTSLCRSQAAQVSATGPKSVDAATANESARSKASTLPPTCPPAGLQSLQLGSSGTGDHTVSLSWNASISSSRSESNPVGYCIYRSTKQSAAQRNPTCAICERVNTVPVASLGCVDNVVEDGVTYYYVVTAINQNSAISSASNEVKVPVGRGGEQKTTSGNGPPFCRVNPVAR